MQQVPVAIMLLVGFTTNASNSEHIVSLDAFVQVLAVTRVSLLRLLSKYLGRDPVARDDSNALNLISRVSENEACSQSRLFFRVTQQCSNHGFAIWMSNGNLEKIIMKRFLVL